MIPGITNNNAHKVVKIDPAAVQDMANNTNGGAASSGGGIVSGIISALFMSGISWTYLDILRGTKSTIEPFKDAFRGFTGLFLGGVILLAILISIDQSVQINDE